MRIRHNAWNNTAFALMWIIWKERNRRTFEGVETSFAQSRSSFRSLIFLRCTHVVPIPRGLGGVWEPIFCRFSVFGLSLVYVALLSSMKYFT